MRLTLLFILFSVNLIAQNLKMNLGDDGSVKDFSGANPKYQIPFLSFEINKKETSTLQSDWKNKFDIKITEDGYFRNAQKLKIVFTNISKDTLNLRNVVPLGRSDKQVFITGLGDHTLSRAHLFIPNKQPVNVIVPDNAWEMGYSSIELGNNTQVFALTRRKSWEKSTRRRFETIIAPQGTVTYELYTDYFQGDWQNGIRKAFQENYLYDLEHFDESLYQRPDLKWIQDTYVMHLIMAWDNWFYDATYSRTLLQDNTPPLHRERGQGGEVLGYSAYQNFIEKSKKLYGGNDVVGIWPTWPTLGLDQRNQWDLFRDLPGGLPKIKELSEYSRKNGSKFFICYNPWDESTSYKGSAKEGQEGHLGGMAELVKAVSADGVVLDTKGESSKELQAAADKARSGVIMYSEGMAVPKNMPSIISGRVHNALYYPPMLNLNKFIRPDFTIYRVAELYLEPIKREFTTSLFNGYGVEMNIFRNGKPAEWMDEQYRYLGRVARVLRENSTLFHSKNYVPLISTLRDKIYVNKWTNQNADRVSEIELYTIYSLIPEGFKAPLFEVDSSADYHFVDIWHHKLLNPVKINDKYYIEAETDAFNQSWLGTNNESEADVIAKFRKSLKVNLVPYENFLELEVSRGTEVRVWYGNPSYDKEPQRIFPKTKAKYFSNTINGDVALNPAYEGKIIVQLFDEKQLIDEQIVEIKTGTPRLISETKPTPKGSTDAMVKVPAGQFKFNVTRGDDFVFYPDGQNGKSYEMKSFFIDQNLVSNADYQSFIKKSKYSPADKHNFLKHLETSKKADTLGNYPVVYVNYEDAQAYCQYYGKRLPTEQEWQYAAQFPDNRDYPWGMKYDSTKVNNGNGKIDKLGVRLPNSLLINDLVGNVWQMTNDIYANASYSYVMLKGGSYFKPTASWWYVQGGPQKLTHRQHLLRVSAGFERNATVGFRCMKDE